MSTEVFWLISENNPNNSGSHEHAHQSSFRHPAEKHTGRASGSAGGRMRPGFRNTGHGRKSASVRPRKRNRGDSSFRSRAGSGTGERQHAGRNGRPGKAGPVADHIRREADLPGQRESRFQCPVSDPERKSRHPLSHSLRTALSGAHGRYRLGKRQGGLPGIRSGAGSKRRTGMGI